MTAKSMESPIRSPTRGVKKENSFGFDKSLDLSDVFGDRYLEETKPRVYSGSQSVNDGATKADLQRRPNARSRSRRIVRPRKTTTDNDAELSDGGETSVRSVSRSRSRRVRKKRADTQQPQDNTNLRKSAASGLMAWSNDKDSDTEDKSMLMAGSSVACERPRRRKSQGRGVSRAPSVDERRMQHVGDTTTSRDRRRRVPSRAVSESPMPNRRLIGENAAERDKSSMRSRARRERGGRRQKEPAQHEDQAIESPERRIKGQASLVDRTNSRTMKSREALITDITAVQLESRVKNETSLPTLASLSPSAALTPSLIQENTTDIQENTTDIQENTTDIQENTTDIQESTTGTQESIKESQEAINRKMEPKPNRAKLMLREPSMRILKIEERSPRSLTEADASFIENASRTSKESRTSRRFDTSESESGSTTVLQFDPTQQDNLFRVKQVTKESAAYQIDTENGHFVGAIAEMFDPVGDAYKLSGGKPEAPIFDFLESSLDRIDVDANKSAFDAPSGGEQDASEVAEETPPSRKGDQGRNGAPKRKKKTDRSGRDDRALRKEIPRKTDRQKARQRQPIAFDDLDDESKTGYVPSVSGYTSAEGEKRTERGNANREKKVKLSKKARSMRKKEIASRPTVSLPNLFDFPGIAVDPEGQLDCEGAHPPPFPPALLRKEDSRLDDSSLFDFPGPGPLPASGFVSDLPKPSGHGLEPQLNAPSGGETSTEQEEKQESVPMKAKAKMPTRRSFQKKSQTCSPERVESSVCVAAAELPADPDVSVGQTPKKNAKAWDSEVESPVRKSKLKTLGLATSIGRYFGRKGKNAGQSSDSESVSNGSLVSASSRRFRGKKHHQLLGDDSSSHDSSLNPF